VAECFISVSPVPQFWKSGEFPLREAASANFQRYCFTLRKFTRISKTEAGSPKFWVLLHVLSNKENHLSLAKNEKIAIMTVEAVMV